MKPAIHGSKARPCRRKVYGKIGSWKRPSLVAWKGLGWALFWKRQAQHAQ